MTIKKKKTPHSKPKQSELGFRLSATGIPNRLDVPPGRKQAAARAPRSRLRGDGCLALPTLLSARPPFCMNCTSWYFAAGANQGPNSPRRLPLWLQEKQPGAWWQSSLPLLSRKQQRAPSPGLSVPWTEILTQWSSPASSADATPLPAAAGGRRKPTLLYSTLL